MNTRPEGAVIVTTPQEVSLCTVRKEVDFCRKLGLPVMGLVGNMSAFVCPCCHVNTAFQRTDSFAFSADAFVIFALVQEEWPLFQGKDNAMEELAQEHQIPLMQKIAIDSVSEALWAT